MGLKSKTIFKNLYLDLVYQHKDTLKIFLNDLKDCIKILKES